MENTIGRCQWCAGEYIKHRPHSLFCSPRCCTRHHNSKNKVVKTIASCLVCGKDFIKSRKDKICCSQKCIKRKYRNLGNIINHNDLKIEVVEFLEDMKRKAHYADLVDIFRLIDIHDKIHPGRFYEDNLDKEVIVSMMYNDIKIWNENVFNEQRSM